MTRSCSRPGCSAGADATFTYDYSRSTVFLDVLSSAPDPNEYDVCHRHAERLTAPRGWTLVDRRRGTAGLAGFLTAP